LQLTVGWENYPPKGLEAKQLGLVTKVFDSKEAMEDGVSAIAEGNVVFL
jgi:hypothetical protein